MGGPARPPQSGIVWEVPPGLAINLFNTLPRHTRREWLSPAAPKPEGAGTRFFRLAFTGGRVAVPTGTGRRAPPRQVRRARAHH